MGVVYKVQCTHVTSKIVFGNTLRALYFIHITKYFTRAPDSTAGLSDTLFIVKVYLSWTGHGTLSKGRLNGGVAVFYHVAPSLYDSFTT